MDLEFHITNQIIRRVDTNKVVNKSKNIYKLHFTIEGEEWEGKIKYILFHYNNENYQYLLNYDDETDKYTIVVPEQVLYGKSFRFTVFGIQIIDEEETRITTRVITVHSLTSGFTTNITTITDEPDLDIVTTLLQKLADKYDDLIFEDNNLICRSEGEVKKILTFPFDDYYTKDEADSLLDGKAETVHNHVVDDVTDFEENVDMDFDNFLTSLTENIRQI